MVATKRTWKPIDGGNRFQCIECEFSHEEPGAVQLHYNRRHGGAVQVEQRKQKPKKQEAGCRHQWRLLRRSDQQEAAAIEAGYSKVCKLCEEVEE